MEYKEKIDLDVYQLQEIEERLNIINHLKQKYNPQIGEILKYHERLQEQMDSIEDGRAKIDILKKEIFEYEQSLINLSLELSCQRKKISQRLAQDIIKECRSNMKDCIL